VRGSIVGGTVEAGATPVVLRGSLRGTAVRGRVPDADAVSASIASRPMVASFRIVTIAADSVDNTKLANMAQNTIKGRVSAGTGDPEDLTAAQVKTLLAYTAADVGAVPTSRTVTAGTGLTGGGALSANITLTVAFGTTNTTACVGNDSRLSDARTPTAHASTHKSGGGDAIKLDELAAPTDITTLNATTSLHGLLPKLGGGTTNFLRADGTWAAPPSGGPDHAGTGQRMLTAKADGTHTVVAEVVWDGTDVTIRDRKVVTEYLHTQGSASAAWTIDHNLGRKPSVDVIDSGGTVWMCEVQHTNDNSCVVRFGYAFSGTARLR